MVFLSNVIFVAIKKELQNDVNELCFLRQRLLFRNYTVNKLLMDLTFISASKHNYNK